MWKTAFTFTKGQRQGAILLIVLIVISFCFSFFFSQEKQPPLYDQTQLNQETEAFVSSLKEAPKKISKKKENNSTKEKKKKSTTKKKQSKEKAS